MRDVIMNELDKIETAHNVKILYAIESGSRGWGFESTDSDYDVRFIYVHQPEWYLSIKDKRDVLELPIDELLDINGWDIRKTLTLFMKSNPTLLEWLSSPIIYMQQTEFINELRVLLNEYFVSKSCVYHYLHMATGNYRGYLKRDVVKIKKYFYVLRPLMACMWVERYGTQPPMLFDELMNSVEISTKVIDEVNKLLIRKKASSEFKEETRIPILNEFIEDKIEYYSEFGKGLEFNKNHNFERLDELFRRSLYGAWEK